MQQQELLPHLFRTEFTKITAVLCKFFGIEHVEIAEDIASDTFLAAAETWGFKGLPPNPTAWLYSVAKNKARNYCKRNTLFTHKIIPLLTPTTYPSTEIEIDLDLSDNNISDSQLKMLFTICHPSIPVESQIGLSLRILCGFGIDEIADAFLTNRETISKRLSRAKERLRNEKIKMEFPVKEEVGGRLQTVLTTLYLLFNEGYYSESRDTVLRKDFCLEAMRLTHLLVENEATNLPEVNALLALMCFHASRFDARKNENDELILYDNQDQSLWNEALIVKGIYFFRNSAKGTNISKYHLEAGIAYWHTRKEDSSGKWEQILQLYNQLLQIEFSPIAALNRTYALSKLYGKETAIHEAEKLDLATNHYYFTLLGVLYKDIDNDKARTHLTKALTLAKTISDKKTIQAKIDNL